WAWKFRRTTRVSFRRRGRACPTDSSRWHSTLITLASSTEGVMARGDRPSTYQPELYDAIAPGYYDAVYARGRGSQWFWHHYRFDAVAKRLPPEVESIVDLGCGPGTFLGHFACRARRALGIDIA